MDRMEYLFIHYTVRIIILCVLLLYINMIVTRFFLKKYRSMKYGVRIKQSIKIT
jgi:hypothetical protein